MHTGKGEHRGRGIYIVLFLVSFMIGFMWFSHSNINKSLQWATIPYSKHTPTSKAKPSKGADNPVLEKKNLATATTGNTELNETIHALSTRVCGSPAVDGYILVKPQCLRESPTAKWWAEYYARGGRQEDLTVHVERAADFDGLAVYWGINNTKATVEDCAYQCLNHMPNVNGTGAFDSLPCNAFAWCPDEECFEPDAHKHHKGDCWLKFTEAPAAPEVNMRGDLPDDYRKRHPKAPARVQWISGVLLPSGVSLTNGTYGPRWKW